MNAYHIDPLYTLYHGDALEVLKQLPDESVHCCVTSPPYWGLRDYGTAKWEGGNPECDHKKYHNDWSGSRLGTNGTQTQESNGGGTSANKAYKETCGKCGAVRIDSQLGLEKTPDEYVGRMVEVFREVRRVLRDDGTLWLNLGDCYASAWSAGNRRNIIGNDTPPPIETRGRICDGLKEKDLVGIPWRVAFALQSDGWYLRSDIIWHKPNPMPESVTDRPTKSHEYIFLLSKRERYYYDAEAIKEPLSESTLDRGYTAAYMNGASQKMVTAPDEVRAKGNWRTKDTAYIPDSRNKRSVWTVPTSPYPEAHFATYPPDLIKPCILAGCPLDGTVLDPFAGSGTTGQVAVELGRKAVLIELNAAYLPLIQQRLHTTPGLRLG